MARITRVLFLGNSITLHAPKADIGWTGNWGMAASAQEKDYAHVLLQRLAAAAGGAAPHSRIENIVDFERGFATFEIEAKFKTHAGFKADIVVLAIGENVAALATEQKKAAFGKAVAALLARLTRDHTPALFVRSTFWPDPAKDSILRQACLNAGGTFVDIAHLARNEANYARAERQFAHAGVAAHPGDTGMAAIADAIWNAMRGNDQCRI